MEDITFYSSWYCPFAQRSWIALEYLDIPYNYQETDPYDKSDEWIRLSRGYGQVPVLTADNPEHSEIQIPGSLRIIEFLEDIKSTSKSLLPASAVEKAEVRYWLDFLDGKIIPYFYRVLKAKNGSPEETEALSSLLFGLETLSAAMSDEGAYFLGKELGAVDVALAPFAFRIELLLSYYKDFKLPDSGGIWPRYQVWHKAVQTHPSYVASIPEGDDYESRLVQFYLPYSTDGGQKDVTITR